jgi:hypothetical protein
LGRVEYNTLIISTKDNVLSEVDWNSFPVLKNLLEGFDRVISTDASVAVFESIDGVLATDALLEGFSRILSSQTGFS